ncbi:alpha/beta fold hydrolase [Bacillus horti]|uniref:Pimeloyl-ACP methyl ester carboxylesterase n=1 Tax=Caldalkalibacillus horti TaxID=77523 RepID=A0ABT9VXE3_9BACI|nr:alpha/beta hydrolase [Bacillus horti]MDQ0165661.1 pimeloyl-ACP methyl ester carboxylesterase [Bacillus horti]
MQRHVFEGIQRDSKELVFWEQLSRLAVPVLIIRGAQKGALLSEEHANMYVEKLADSACLTLKNSNHNIFDDEPNELLQAVKSFLKKV